MNVNVCDNPIFVLGPPRSGTSMMQWALRQHPALWGGQESDFMIPLVDKLREVWEFGNQRERLHWLSGQNVGWEEFLGHVGVGVNSMYMSRSRGLRWVEQTPQYTLHLDDICLLFPGARFVFMVRDGREVVASLRSFVNPVSHERACRIWRDFITAGQAFSKGSRGGQLLMASYRNAVGDTEAEMMRIFQFIGEPFAQESVDFIRKRNPINSSFAGEERSDGPRWLEWSNEEREVFADIAGDLLIGLGFEPDRGWLATQS
jgi:hypothetical protein